VTPALTPALAVDYLRELSADIREVVVLDAAGSPLAGTRELGRLAAELLEAAPEAEELEVGAPGGVVHAARGEQHAIVAVCGRFALSALIRYDLKVVLGELAAGAAPGPATASRAA
jgi:hypothetical protein